MVAHAETEGGPGVIALEVVLTWRRRTSTATCPVARLVRPSDVVAPPVKVDDVLDRGERKVAEAVAVDAQMMRVDRLSVGDQGRRPRSLMLRWRTTGEERARLQPAMAQLTRRMAVTLLVETSTWISEESDDRLRSRMDALSDPSEIVQE